MPGRMAWLMASLIKAMRRSTRKTPGSAQATATSAGIPWISSEVRSMVSTPAVAQALGLGPTLRRQCPLIGTDPVGQAARREFFQAPPHAAEAAAHSLQHRDRVAVVQAGVVRGQLVQI